LQVYIDSRIPNAYNLLVKVRYTQKFREIKKAWLLRNNILDQAADIYFTWCGLKVFDASSAKVLGVQLDENGRLILKGSDDGFAEDGDKLVLVATTNAVVEGEKRMAEEEKAREAARQNGELSSATNEAPAERHIKVQLRSKDRNELKLKVKESTTIAKIASAFLSQHKLSAQFQVRIEFDGETLDHGLLVGQTEMMELDDDEPVVLDVYIQ